MDLQQMNLFGFAEPETTGTEQPKAGKNKKEHSKTPSEKPSLEALAFQFQNEIPFTHGERFLQIRGINSELARSLGVGYAENGKWPQYNGNGKPINQWEFGRVTFPCTNPAGEVINLYGRAISTKSLPLDQQYTNLEGPKGVFNAKALSAETVYVCRSPFDALSIITAGIDNACAVYEPENVNWNWIEAQQVVFCLKNDPESPWHKVALEGLEKGKEVSFLPDSFFGPYHDVNAVWKDTKQLDLSNLIKLCLPVNWDEAEADRLLIATIEKTKKSYPEGAFRYAEYNPNLKKLWYGAENEINKAYKNNDIVGLKEALKAYEVALTETLFSEYMKFSFTPGAFMPIN